MFLGIAIPYICISSIFASVEVKTEPRAHTRVDELLFKRLGQVEGLRVLLRDSPEDGRQVRTGRLHRGLGFNKTLIT